MSFVVDVRKKKLTPKEREKLERRVPKVCKSYAYAVGNETLTIKHHWNRRSFAISSPTVGVTFSYTSAFRSARIRDGVENALQPIIMKRYADPVVAALTSERGRLAFIAQLNAWAAAADEYIRDEVGALLETQ